MIKKINYLILSCLVCFQISVGAQKYLNIAGISTLTCLCLAYGVNLSFEEHSFYTVLKKYELYYPGFRSILPPGWEREDVFSFDKGYKSSQISCHQDFSELLANGKDAALASSLIGNNACYDSMNVPACHKSNKEVAQSIKDSYLVGALAGNHACNVKKAFKKTFQPKSTYKHKCSDPRFSRGRRKR